MPPFSCGAISNLTKPLSPVIDLWYEQGCLCHLPGAVQAASALSELLTSGLTPGGLLTVVISVLGLFFLNRLGGIPLPVGRFGTALFVAWMGVQLAQYVVVLMSLLMTGVRSP